MSERKRTLETIPECDIIIRDYHSNDEQEWLDVHACIMVDSYAWWTVIHKKPEYEHDVIDLIMVYKGKLIGFITIEMNADIVKNRKEAGFVWEFGIYRTYRGQNLGWQLIQKAHRIMQEMYGITKSLWYSQDPKAKSYYEHLGMHEIERHWQFSVYPDESLQAIFKQNGFTCWEMRGSCRTEDFDRVKENFQLVQDNDPLNPKLCIGYELVLQ